MRAMSLHRNDDDGLRELCDVYDITTPVVYAMAHRRGNEIYKH